MPVIVSVLFSVLCDEAESTSNMAGQIGRVTGSVATIHNEISPALATANFDFTVIKLEVPSEFNALGATISRKRKADAEEGGLHRTARRLGALFGNKLPQTEALFKAYGKRVSEISSMPSINPREGADKEGIFAGYVGADTTSIWAAATSGSAAIAVHLLGCMLARIFTGPEAISVWVELVQKHKECIRAEKDSHLYSHEHEDAMAAAQQEISRNDLASWDASARAWLQSADQAKELHHKQTMLILKNANVPVNNEPETYASVMKAWTVALEAMDNLVLGLPQRVQDGSALLAISSWHLYPDMVVYGGSCVEVKQMDPIFDSAALLTLGLQHVRADLKSVYWSLPLACLQYYGHPIHTSRTVGQENSRITYQQFAYIILGSLFDGWKTYSTTNEDGLHWIERLATILSLSPRHRFDHARKPTWLIYVIQAAQEYSDSDDSEKAIAQQLMSLGRRWSTFLHPPPSTPPPLFGLSQIDILLTVLKTDQERVGCLRKLCTHLNADGTNFFIRYVAATQGIEYASVEPMRRYSTKRTFEGEVKEAELLLESPVRWISLSDRQLHLCRQRRDDFLNVTQAVKKLEELEKLDKARIQRRDGLHHNVRPFGSGFDSILGITPEGNDRLRDIQELKEIIAISQRRAEIESLGELFLPVSEYYTDHQYAYYGSSAREWGTSLIFADSLEFLEASKELLAKVGTDAAKRSAIPVKFFVGKEDVASLHSINRVQIPQGLNLVPGPTFVQEFLSAEKVSQATIFDHFIKSHEFVQSEISCLRACAMMAEIYHLLPGATISTLVVKLSLSRARWVPQSKDNQLLPLTLAQAFACIAMFESGTCNLDPSNLVEVFAMASGNSLYVAGSLLCDPHQQPSPTEIRRVIGNVGRAGITFLIAPPDVKLRPKDPEKWMFISHRKFDGHPENHFKKTSLHLSFTDYAIPLITEENSRHIIDRTVFLVETLISVYDGGTWVGEVDILKSFRSQIHRVIHEPTTNHTVSTVDDGEKPNYQQILVKSPQLASTSVENWDELIEAPCTGAIAIRAHKNWLARLAAMAICVKQEMVPIILPEDVCWTCCAELTQTLQGNDRFALIY